MQHRSAGGTGHQTLAVLVGRVNGKAAHCPAHPQEDAREEGSPGVALREGRETLVMTSANQIPGNLKLVT